MHIIKLIGLVVGGETPFDGEYLKEYDPNKRGKDPSGSHMLAHIVTTKDPDQAMQFPSAVEAWQKWGEISRVWSKREDGKPNRPLTAFTVEISKLP